MVWGMGHWSLVTLGASPRGWVVGGTFDGAPANPTCFAPVLHRARRTCLLAFLRLVNWGAVEGRGGFACWVATNSPWVCIRHLHALDALQMLRKAMLLVLIVQSLSPVVAIAAR